MIYVMYGFIYSVTIGHNWPGINKERVRIKFVVSLFIHSATVFSLKNTSL